LAKSTKYLFLKTDSAVNQKDLHSLGLSTEMMPKTHLMTRMGGSMMEGGSLSSGHVKMTATSGERRRRGGGQGPGLLLEDGAGVEAGTAGGAGAGASEERE